jgi:hypothetical protein
LPIDSDFDPSQNEEPFELAERSSNLVENNPDIFYCKPTTESFDSFAIDEAHMETLSDDKIINLPDFDDKNDIRLRICPKFYNEGPKNFKVTMKYKIIKVYEESKSDPIPMTMTRLIKLRCDPPFKVTFDYEVKDWLTNELNVKDSEVNQNENESFVKVPVGERVPLSINITSISEKPMTVKNVDLDILSSTLIEKVSRNDFQQIDKLEEDDTICAGFIVKPLKCSNDTGQYGDVLIEWYRKSELTGKVFRNICRLPTTALSIVSSPL